MRQLLTLIGSNLTTLVLCLALGVLVSFLVAAIAEAGRTLWRRWQRHEAAQQAARDRARVARRALELQHRAAYREHVSYRPWQEIEERVPKGPDEPGRVA